MKKLAHLQLKDCMGNKETLICNLTEDGYISYSLYGGWSSSGIPFALSNLQCQLPIEKLHEDETKEEFVKRLIKTIDTKSVCKCYNNVEPIKF